MEKVHVIYGSTTGMTEAVAAKIANSLGAQVFNVNAADAAAFDAELLVLGSSTWGIGDLQDDWAAKQTYDARQTAFFEKVHKHLHAKVDNIRGKHYRQPIPTGLSGESLGIAPQNPGY